MKFKKLRLWACKECHLDMTDQIGERLSGPGDLNDKRLDSFLDSIMIE